MIARALMLCAVVALLAGCAPERTAGPPRIRYGRQACVECRMLIGEERHAAAAAAADGAVAFDAIECLARWLAVGGAASRVWVHDYATAAWLDGRAAWFVRSPQLSTPMGAGLVALATEPAARALIGRVGGELLRFEELPRAVQAREATMTGRHP